MHRAWMFRTAAVILCAAAAAPGCRTKDRAQTPSPAGPARTVPVDNVQHHEFNALLSFTEAQWRHATADMPELQALTEKSAVLAATPMPDRSGGFVVGPVRCPPGCSPTMMYERQADRERRGGVSFTPHPDDVIIPLCWCEGELDISFPPPPPPRGKCRLVIRLDPPHVGFARRALIECESIDCRGRCVFGTRRLQDGRVLLGCECQ